MVDRIRGGPSPLRSVHTLLAGLNPDDDATVVVVVATAEDDAGFVLAVDEEDDALRMDFDDDDGRTSDVPATAVVDAADTGRLDVIGCDQKQKN